MKSDYKERSNLITKNKEIRLQRTLQYEKQRTYQFDNKERSNLLTKNVVV